MPNINITVAGKIATNAGGAVIVCGNSDYTITFDFDSDWGTAGYRTARFLYVKGGHGYYVDKTFNGNVVDVPILSDITEVYVGVYAGDLITSTLARIPAARSVLCGLPVHEEPSEDVYLQILALLQETRGVYIGSEEPTDSNILAWIDPDGETEDSDTLKQIADNLANMGDRLEAAEAEIADLKYVPIDITGISNNVGTVELGRTITGATISIRCNRTPAALTLDGKAVTVAEGATAFTVDLTGLSVSANKSWTAVATDERDATDSASTSVTFLNGVYYGTLAYGAEITSAVLLGLTKKLQSGRSLTFSVSPNGNRPVYAIPTRYGTPTFKIGGFEYEWEKVATFDFTNASGYTESYDVWMHGQDMTGAVTVSAT